jgi:xanthine dehydrogenase YagR molybdenum-binding subunit
MADENKDIYYVRGIPVPETPLPGKEPAVWKETNVVGTRLPRVDAYERVSGSAVYPSDVHLPNMLWAILGCPHLMPASGTSTRTQRPRCPGSDIIMEPRQPICCGKGCCGRNASIRPAPLRGEAVAAVAAETPYHARDAINAIRVDYEVLPFLADERRALQAGSPPVHSKGNLSKTDTYERGDVAKGFAAADVVLEETYRTECELHTLEPRLRQLGGRSPTVSPQGSRGPVQGRRRQLPLARVRSSAITWAG